MATRQPLRTANENSGLPKPSGLPQPSGLPKPKTGLPKPSGLARPTATSGLARPAATGLTKPTDTGLTKPAATVLTKPSATGLTKPAATGMTRSTTMGTTQPAAPSTTNGRPPVQKRKLTQPTTTPSVQPAKKTRLNSSTSESTSSRTTTSLRKSSSTSSINRVGASGARPGARAATTRAGAGAASSKAPAAGNKPPAGGSNGKRPAWDLKGRMADMEMAMNELKSRNQDLKGKVTITGESKAAIEEQNYELSQKVQNFQSDLERKEELNQKLRIQISELETTSREESRRLKNELEDVSQEKSTLERKVKNLEADLDVSRQEGTNLRMTINTMTAAQSSIKAEMEALKVSLDQSEKDNREKAALISQLRGQVADHEKTIADQESEIRDHEMSRRKLHNTIQELKGNIRVFCRVRPLIGDEALGIDDIVPPHISFPDPKESKMIELDKVAGDMTLNESSISAAKRGSKYAFTFDKVFTPEADQGTVFEEISQLVQSSLDGYNVCIFAYGQTGSGKTFTMEGYDEHVGMIPRAVEQVFKTAQDLTTKGWDYEFEASFLEIYNDSIRDLLSKKDGLKHEIKKVANSATSEIYVTNLTCKKVTDKDEVQKILDEAATNRAVAETKCNSRSSRSHSVFRLRISGKNNITHDNCVATLNLVDLAGSERLKDSGSEGDRLKETKAINTSLANLGNVIMALANKDSHVPYRNCKLTYLLQNSLGGNSKCLMFVNVAPKEECFNETLNTLRFATKVNNCNIGTASRVTK